MSVFFADLLAAIEAHATPELAAALKDAHDLGVKEIQLVPLILKLAARDCLTAVQSMIEAIKTPA